jgi:molybdate transport system substrate-binding protein
MTRQLNVMAAGSLRAVWPPLMAHFTRQSGIGVSTQFGPAGLLRQRIEAGEQPDLFASANVSHPQRLLALGRAQRVETFTGNRLCLTVHENRVTEHPSWLALLNDPGLRLGTSTPLADPSGDYTWQLFEKIERRHPGMGERLRQSALPLVGGAESQPAPAGELAAAWLIRTGQCELFIGYVSYARRLAECDGLRVIEIPEDYNIRADYAFAQCHARAEPLSDFLLSTAAQGYLTREGFTERD